MENKENRMRIVLVASAIALLTSAGAWTNGVVHSVHVGGPDVCEGIGLKNGCDANFSITVNEFSDGSVSGRWIDVFQVEPGEDPVTGVAAIDCLHVNGNEAWVAGEVVGPDFTGLRVGTRVMDNGTSARDFPDMTSGTFVYYGDCAEEPNFPLAPFADGQVKVR